MGHLAGKRLLLRNTSTCSSVFNNTIGAFKNLQCSASRIKLLSESCCGRNSLFSKSQARVGESGLLVDKVNIHNLFTVGW